MGANYGIYIEDYVLSYLKREVDSLALSEIFFYGKRENGGRKFLVYGAGRKKGIDAFADYELLEELVCRLTQAGPVFMVREKNGDYKVSGFQTFYADNEAMQNYLIEWTSNESDRRTETGRKHIVQPAPQEAAKIQTPFEAEGKSKAGSAMSVQLGLILVVLVAIVISSANSYDRMERLNQSAKEVFFAIENQEAGQENKESDASGKEPAGDKVQREKKGEILVERDTAGADVSVEDAARAENDGLAAAGGTEVSESSVIEDASAVSDSPVPPEENADVSDVAAQEEGTEGKSDTKREESGEKEKTEDVSEEALSRNIMRYYEVEHGDTLYTISQKIYGDASRVEKICEINDISDPDKISEGQKIILP